MGTFTSSLSLFMLWQDSEEVFLCIRNKHSCYMCGKATESRAIHLHFHMPQYIHTLTLTTLPSHTHTHTHTHMHTHTCKHTCTHTYAHTRTHMHTHVCTDTHTHAHTCTHTHVHTYADWQYIAWSWTTLGNLPTGAVHDQHLCTCHY